MHTNRAGRLTPACPLKEIKRYCTSCPCQRGETVCHKKAPTQQLLNPLALGKPPPMEIIFQLAALARLVPGHTAPPPPDPAYRAGACHSIDEVLHQRQCFPRFLFLRNGIQQLSGGRIPGNGVHGAPINVILIAFFCCCKTSQFIEQK